MDLATTLKSQAVPSVIRQVGINPNYWYPLDWSEQLKPRQVKPAVVWEKRLAMYRDESGRVHILEDRCPHRGVELHRGKVQGESLACAYHGWTFNGTDGACTGIPYLAADQKLPCASVQSYPVREKYGLIWVFPGDESLADQCPLLDIAEYDSDDWLMVPITAEFGAHFSICNENAMDVFHGFLHEELQGWFDPTLLELKTTDSSVFAKYNVSYKGHLAKFLGLCERADEVTTLPISIHYRYPHYASSLEGVSSVYLMRLPVGLTESRSFALFFFKLHLPKWLIRSIRPLLSTVVQRFMLRKFLDQDIEMMESEQRIYSHNPEQRFVEINPAIIALQRVIVRQYEQFVQQSKQSSDIPSLSRQASVSRSQASLSAVSLPETETETMV